MHVCSCRIITEDVHAGSNRCHQKGTAEVDICIDICDFGDMCRCDAQGIQAAHEGAGSSMGEEVPGRGHEGLEAHATLIFMCM